MNKGKCYICHNPYSDKGMARHIKSCLEKGAEVDKSNKRNNGYLLKVQGKYQSDYYLYLLVDGCVLLSELDQYLRGIWLECCGHLSGFQINGCDYDSDSSYDDDFWSNAEDMNIEINEVLNKGTSFTYTYDYGSSTELDLTVIEKYKSMFEEKGIRLVGRNMQKKYKCGYCKNKAEKFYENLDAGSYGVVCSPCMEKLEDGNEEIYFSNVYNSPRTGVCGYNGPSEDIMFMKHKKTKGRKKKSKNQDKNVDFLETLLSGGLTSDDMARNTDFKKMLNSFAMSRKYTTPPFMIEEYELELEGDTLKDHLSLLRKKELDTIRKKLNVKKASGLKKDALVKRLNEFLMNNIRDILLDLSPYLYIILMEINNSQKPMLSLIEDIPMDIDFLRESGLLFAVCKDTVTCEFSIPSDIKTVFKELEKDNEFQKQREFSNKVFFAITSVFYYWGIVEKSDLIKEVGRLLDATVDEDFYKIVDNILMNSEQTPVQMEVVEGKIYFYMFADDVDDKVTSSSWENAEYPTITQDMIPEGNVGWLNLVLHNPYLKWLHDLLGKSTKVEEIEDVPEGEILDMVAFIAQVCMNIRPGIEIRQLARVVELEEEMLQVPYMKELLNNIFLYIPNYWMKGNSVSGEIHVINDENMDWTPEFLNNKSATAKGHRKKSANNAATRWKIGRNEPCPCGSGKKYKKCCLNK